MASRRIACRIIDLLAAYGLVTAETALPHKMGPGPGEEEPTGLDGERLELAAPATRWETAYLAMIDYFEAASEWKTPGRNTQLARSNFAAFVQRLEEDERGVNLAPGIVPSSQYWLLRHDADISFISRLSFLAPGRDGVTSLTRPRLWLS